VNPFSLKLRVDIATETIYRLIPDFRRDPGEARKALGVESTALRIYSPTRFHQSELCVLCVDKNLAVLRDLFTPIDEDQGFENYSAEDIEKRAYKVRVVFRTTTGEQARFIDYADGVNCSSKKEKEARIVIYKKVKTIVFDPQRRSKALAARKMLNPWTIAIEYLGGDGVLACEVRPIMLAVRDEFQEMEASNAVSVEVMTDAHWTVAKQIINVRIDGGAAHGEKRKCGLLSPHHVVAQLLNPFDKRAPKLESGAANPKARLPNVTT